MPSLKLLLLLFFFTFGDHSPSYGGVTVSDRYPRAPTMEQRISLVTLAGMHDAEIVSQVISAAVQQITSTVVVRAVKYYVSPSCP